MNDEKVGSEAVAEVVATGQISVVAFQRVISVFEGTAFGLSQPTLVAQILIACEETMDFSDLDQKMEALVGEPLSAETSKKTGDKGLLERLQHWCAVLQRSHNIPIFDSAYYSLTPQSQQHYERHRAWHIALPYFNPKLTTNVWKWIIGATAAILTVATDKDTRIKKSLSDLKVLRSQLAGGGLTNSNMIHFLEAAHHLDMPFAHLTSGIYAIGNGQNSRWLNSSITDKTPALGVALAGDKKASADLLRLCCLPAPEHCQVVSEEQAVSAAEALGYPVVIKPIDQEQGRGVFAGLRTESSLRIAYRAARKVSSRILVEKHQEGEDYRFSVVHNQVTKVMHRRPASVTGDGQHSVSQLIKALQSGSDFQRDFRRAGKFRLDLGDEEVLGLLAEQGLEPDDIPESSRRVLLRRKSNISCGGSHEMLPLDTLHPDNCALAVSAANALGLDIAGIDLIIPDAALPWHESGGIICEINAKPQLGYRDMPELYSNILLDLVPLGGKIPLYLLPVDEGQGSERLSQWREAASRFGCNALSTPGGVWRNGKQRMWRPKNSFAAARAMLLDKEVTSGLMVMTHYDIVAHGLPVADFKVLKMVPQQDQQNQQTELSADSAKATQFVRLHTSERAKHGAAAETNGVDAEGQLASNHAFEISGIAP